MRILVIGGTRFMGASAVQMLVISGHEVACFHRTEGPGGLKAEVRHIQGDRRRLPEYATALRAFAPEVVVDMVAMTEADASALVDVFRGHARRTVVVSSMDVYRAYGRLTRSEPGPIEPMPVTEDSPLRERLYPYRSDSPAEGTPPWTQDYDKILVERAVSAAPDLLAALLRMPAVYGENDGQHRFRDTVRQMDAGAERIELTAAQAGFRWSRAFVDNAAHAIVLAATDDRSAGRTYNVAEPDAPTEAEWIRRIADVTRWNGEVAIVPDESVEDDGTDYRQDLIAETSRIRRELGYTEIVPVEEAVRRTVAWERETP